LLSQTLHKRIQLQQNAKSERDLPIENSKEQRKFGRRTVFKPAVLKFDDGSSIAATVLDLSDGGAKIKVSNPESIANEFFLEIPSDDVIVRCRRARSDLDGIGAEFIKAPRRLSWIKK
jgi:hypothetical protein